MAVFEYTALNGRGRKTSGIVDADTLWGAKTKLRNQGLFPTSIHKIQDQRAGKSHTILEKLGRPFHRVRSGELSMITRQLATLLSAGFPLVHALSTLIPQAKSASMVRVLSRIKDNVQEGDSFSAALGRHPQVFSSLYVNMAHAGESSGTLEIVLERLADVTEHAEETRKKIQSALAYPVFMGLIGFGVLLILLAWVVPGIVHIFSDMNQTLPLPTRLLIQVSEFFRLWWWAVLVLLTLILLGFPLLRKAPGVGLALDRIWLFLPIAGPLLQKNIAARFARTLGSLMENGVPMLTGLGITKTIVDNQQVALLVEQAAERVEQGGQLSDALDDNPCFPYLAVQMIKIGETSGKMETMLKKIADIYEKEVQMAVITATSLIEPVIILLMGLVVGSVIMAICLPIFDMNQLIR